MNSVVNSPELREVYNENLSKITEYYAGLSQNLKLFDKYKALKAAPEFAQLNTAQKKIIDNELRDFRLGGAELPDAQKARYLQIQERLSELSSRFSDNLLDATNDFTLVIENKDELSGLPDDVLQAAQEAAQEVGKSGWLFTLKAPSYMPIMQYADNRSLREKMYRAYGTRASEFGKTEWDNTALMDEIVKLRGEEAQLLGFANYGELSLASKMASSPQQVVEFMRELSQRARPFAEKDLSELRKFARAELEISEVQSWDVGYASEKLREQRYAFSDFLRGFLCRLQHVIRQTAQFVFVLDDQREIVGGIQQIVGKARRQFRQAFLNLQVARLLRIRQLRAAETKIAQLILDNFFARRA